MKRSLLIKSMILMTAMLASTVAAAQDKLIFAIDLIRHGDRTPTGSLPSNPEQWEQGFGQLTATGMQQEYNLGMKLRSVYVDQYHLLPANYSAPTIYIRSTDIDRTLMSAQSFLLGFYPLGTGAKLPDSSTPALPAAFQPIPIHTAPVEKETLLIPDNESYHFHDLLEKYVYPTKEWQDKTAEYQPRFENWGKALGMTITNLSQFVFIADVLFIDQKYHHPLPEGISEEDAKEIIALGHWAFVAMFQNPNVTKVTGHELLATFASHLQKATQPNNALKYVLYSAHDSTILSTLGALGAPLSDVPPYSSDLSIALFDMGHETYYVKVTFNDQPVSLPACANSGVDNACTLKQFIDLTAGQ